MKIYAASKAHSFGLLGRAACHYNGRPPLGMTILSLHFAIRRPYRGDGVHYWIYGREDATGRLYAFPICTRDDVSDRLVRQAAPRANVVVEGIGTRGGRGRHQITSIAATDMQGLLPWRFMLNCLSAAGGTPLLQPSLGCWPTRPGGAMVVRLKPDLDIDQADLTQRPLGCGTVEQFAECIRSIPLLRRLQYTVLQNRGHSGPLSLGFVGRLEQMFLPLLPRLFVAYALPIADRRGEKALLRYLRDQNPALLAKAREIFRQVLIRTEPAFVLSAGLETTAVLMGALHGIARFEPLASLRLRRRRLTRGDPILSAATFTYPSGRRAYVVATPDLRRRAGPAERDHDAATAAIYWARLLAFLSAMAQQRLRSRGMRKTLTGMFPGFDPTTSAEGSVDSLPGVPQPTPTIQRPSGSGTADSPDRPQAAVTFPINPSLSPITTGEQSGRGGTIVGTAVEATSPRHERRADELSRSQYSKLLSSWPTEKHLCPATEEPAPQS